MGLWFTRQLSKSAKILQVVKPLIIIPPAFMPGGIQFSYFRLSICPFVCSFVRISFRRVRAKIYVRVSQVGYISPTTHQKTFIFGPYIPWKVSCHSMTPDSMVHATGWASGKNLWHIKNVFSIFLLWKQKDSWPNMDQPCDIDLWVIKLMSAWPIFHGPVTLP